MRELSTKLLFCVLTTAAAAYFSTAQDLRTYPGSRPDGKASQQASAVQRGMEVQVYSTSDEFEKVYAFYKALYKEVSVPFPKQTLPSGKEVNWAFFVLDGAKDLMHSSHWMKIQRPYISRVDDDANFQDVRDITVIQRIRRKSPR